MLTVTVTKTKATTTKTKTTTRFAVTAGKDIRYDTSPNNTEGPPRMYIIG